MGGSYWSDDVYRSKVTTKTSAGKLTFDYDADVRAGRTAKAVHKLLDPKGLKMRESRDSTNHLHSNAIVVALDVTGSMASVSPKIHAKLPNLMGLLTRKNYIPDPQILFAAIGDATCDSIPLQVGQFESGAEMEDDISHFVLEGGGGGQQTESYELMAYIGARKTSIDCLEKRGRKGYFFFIGDEMNYSRVKRNEVQSLIGEDIGEDISTEQIFKELKKKYTVFFVLPEDASNGHDESIMNHWRKLLGAEHVLRLAKADGVADLIATQIGMCEGTIDSDDAVRDMIDGGTSKALATLVAGTISGAYKGKGDIARVTPGALPTGGADDVRRI